MSEVRTVGCNPPATETGSAIRWVTTHPTVSRLATVIACCLLPAINSFADATHVEKEDGLTIIRMEVTPADEPVPAFKHRLMFDVHERLPGNRPQWYMRAYPEQTTAWKKWFELDDNEEFERCYQSGTPVSEADWKQFGELARSLGSLVDESIVAGAKRYDCDWGLRTHALRGPETISFLLPEFQSARSWSRMTNLQVRWGISEGRYEDAIRYLRANYQLGRDVAEEPIVVCGLIGIAITGIANGSMTDLIAAPDSPNMYWALSELPSPPVSLTEALNSDLAFPERIFPVLGDAESVVKTAEEWNAVWKRLGRAFSDYDLDDPDRVPEKLTERVVRDFMPLLTGFNGYSHAKRRLVDWGFDSEAVEVMAVGEVLAIYSARVYRIAADDFQKANCVAFHQARKIDDDAERGLREMRPLSDGQNREITPIASILLPAVQGARSAETRSARDSAALRAIEALRMHAARNGGKWPRTLADVTCVPVPNNPATDKPFLYHLENGKTAVLDLPDWEGFPGYSRRYEITIKP